MSYRLPPIPGEWIDRNQRIEFTFEGQRFWGYAGDTISSALWASGQRILGRSFKYHRPRGILSLANHDTNTLMQSGQELNVRADVTTIAPGMNLSAINTFGGVMGDRASVLNFFSPFLPVGFYYKAFHTKKLFPFWERLIRKMTGLGEVDVTSPRISTPKRYDFCDVLVIGAGVSGLSAALAAANVGADVVIADENAQAGGSGSYQLGGKQDIAHETAQLLEAVRKHSQIRLYTSTQAAGYYADHWIPLVHSNCMSKMRAKAVIVASGAYEQPAVFHNNDLPGVMLASAAQQLIYRYAVKPMNRAVVLTANSDGYRAALDLAAHGVTVQAIVDSRNNLPDAPLLKGGWGDLIDRARSLNIPVYFGYCIYEARPNPAGDGVSSAVICPLNADGKPQTGLRQTIPCDGIVMSVGWAPAANLLYQAGAKMQFDYALQQFAPAILPDGVFACGRINGVFDFEQKILDGDRAGLEAAIYLGFQNPVGAKHLANRHEIESKKSDPNASPSSPSEECRSHPYPFIEHPAGKNFVDFDEDLQLKDFFNAAKEGFDNIELLKRYTTVGMGPSQGKHSNMNALRILAAIKNKTPDEIGTTTARPLFHPVPLSHLAGRSFTPERETPLHSRHADLGAKFMLAGNWRRPEYYAQPGKSREQCIQSEAKTVRTNVGMIDVGTLGKLEIRGPDAAEFLERIYTGKYATLKSGMTRYALMLDETGVIVDDGVIARLAPDRFYFTTTTSGAANIYRELSRLNTIWQLDCGLVNLTGARAAVNLAGPRSREVLSKLTNLDLSGSAFPYLAVREAIVAGIPAILMRVGFVGEWGYEIHVPAEYAPALWDSLMEAGEPFNIRPFGVEAQRLLRLEKGHIIIGQDTDGLTTPTEANLEWAVKMDKPFFIGKRSLQITSKRLPKQKLVGFILNAEFNNTPPQECHLVIYNNEIAGRVTSMEFSPSLQRYIGLAYLKPELADKGNQFSIHLSDRSLVTATVTPTPFYDPENLRQKEAVKREEVAV
jgi:sarcosine oxidase subunit alpha